MFCNSIMKSSASEKYLGDYMSHSLSESVFITVQRRKGPTMRLINEIKFTIEDIRANNTGGLVTGIDIWIWQLHLISLTTVIVG